MYKILKAEKLADKIYLMDVEAPRVARASEILSYFNLRGKSPEKPKGCCNTSFFLTSVS